MDNLLNWAKRLDNYIWFDEINSKNVEDAVKAANAIKILKDKEAIFPLLDAIENRIKDTRVFYIEIVVNLRVKRRLAPLKEELKAELKQIELPKILFDSLKKFFKDQKGKEEKDIDPEQMKNLETKMNSVLNYIREMRTNIGNALNEVNPSKELEKMIMTIGREKSSIDAFLKDLETLENFEDVDKIIEELKTFYDNESNFFELSKSIFEILVKMAENTPIEPYINRLKEIGSELGNKFVEQFAELGNTETMEQIKDANKSSEKFNSLINLLLEEINEIQEKAVSTQLQVAFTKQIDNARVLIAIIETLQAICSGNEAIEPLMELINSLDLSLQKKLLDLIKEERDPLEISFRNLQRKHELIITKVFKALAKFKDLSIIDRIIDILNKGDTQMKRRAIILLAQLGDSKIIKELTRFLNDDDIIVQEYAMIALKQMVTFLKGMDKDEILNYVNLDYAKK